MQELQVAERALFLDAREGCRLFSVLHRAAGASPLGLVICSPVHAEMAKNYRREVLLARAVARCGIPVMRFHYRGAGNSHGGDGHDTITTMLEDAASAAEALRAHCDVDRVAVVGTRVGGLVAARLATGLPGTPLAVWEPVLSAKSYFRELYRATVISALKTGTTPAGSLQGFVRQIVDNEMVDVLGHPITADFYESVVRAVDEQSVRQSGAGPKFLGQLSSADQLRADLRVLQDAWLEQGQDVTTQLVGADEAWWFGGAGDSSGASRRAGLPLVDATAKWLARMAAVAA